MLLIIHQCAKLFNLLNVNNSSFVRVLFYKNNMKVNEIILDIKALRNDKTNNK